MPRAMHWLLDGHLIAVYNLKMEKALSKKQRLVGMVSPRFPFLIGQLVFDRYHERGSDNVTIFFAGYPFRK